MSRFRTTDDVKDELNEIIDDMESAREIMSNVFLRFQDVIEANPVPEMRDEWGPLSMMEDSLSKWTQSIQDMFGYYDDIRELE